MRERELSRAQIQAAENLGGLDPQDFADPDLNPPSYDKGSHRERSQYHQPNHHKHWKKEAKQTQRA